MYITLNNLLFIAVGLFFNCTILFLHIKLKLFTSLWSFSYRIYCKYLNSIGFIACYKFLMRFYFAIKYIALMCLNST